MAEPSTATFTPGTLPDLSDNIVNQKSFTVSGSHNASVQTITTSATISGITAPQYLCNHRTSEIIYAEGISGTTFTTCTRGADGSTAYAMQTGDVLRPVISANLYNQMVREILAMAAVLDNADPVALRAAIAQEVLKYQKDDSHIDHGRIQGLSDDDHTQYIRHALTTAANDFLVASGSGAFVKQTLAETLTTLGKAAASGLASLDGSSLVVQNPANAATTAAANKIPLADAAGVIDTNYLNIADIALYARFFN